MVNETQFTQEQLNQKFVSLEREIEILKRLLHNHLGHQQGAVTTNVPHPTMSAISRGSYVVTNDVVDRTYDADTVLVAELADIVATLISDLQEVKILG
jgi:hypothetical protein